MNIDTQAMAEHLNISRAHLNALLYPNDSRRPRFQRLEEARNAYQNAQASGNEMQAAWALASWCDFTHMECRRSCNFFEAMRAWERRPPDSRLDKLAIRALCMHATNAYDPELQCTRIQHVCGLAQQTNDQGFVDDVLQQFARFFAQ